MGITSGIESVGKRKKRYAAENLVRQHRVSIGKANDHFLLSTACGQPQAVCQAAEFRHEFEAATGWGL